MSIKSVIKSAKHNAYAFINKAGKVLQIKKEKFDVKIGHYKKAQFSIADLILKNAKCGELMRLDIAVRYLAIEEYFQKNNVGYVLYKKMQDARVGNGYSTKALEKFVDLIHSYEINGYDQNSFILLDEHLNLIDGSHRMALGIYFGTENITAYIVHSNHFVEYSVDWFFQNGFSSNEIAIITAKAKELMTRATKPFSCVIWSPAVKFTDQIIDDLKYYGNVVSVQKYSYREEEYYNIVRAIYAIDDIEKWKIEKKIEHMKGEKSEAAAIDIVFSDPMYRIKKANGLPLSTVGERAKKSLRAKYKSQVPNYYFDIIMHIGDNLYQSQYMRQIFEPGIDMHNIIQTLSKYKYAITKSNVPFFPSDFPNHIPIGKDIDIICVPEDFFLIAQELKSLTDKYIEYEMKILECEYNIKIRMEKMGHLVLLLDVSCQLSGITNSFFIDALNNREKKGEYMCLSDPFEYIYRAVVYMQNKKKTYHLAYLREHWADYNPVLIAKYTLLKETDLNKILG